MLKRLRWKFAAVIICLAAVLLCVILGMLYSFTVLSVSTDITMKMQSVCDALARPGPMPDGGILEDRLHFFVIMPGQRGELIAVGSGTVDLSDGALMAELYETAMTGKDTSGLMETHQLEYMRVSGRPGTVLYMDISDDMRTIDALGRSCIAVGGVALVLLAVLSYGLAGWLIRPVAQTWEQQKQFVADASHELKTPLTVIMTNTEMLASPDYSPSEKERFVSNTQEMTKRMRYLVEGMLDLARVDNGVVQAAFTRLNYSALVEGSLLTFEPVFFESGRVLDWEILPDLHLKGSEQHLAQVTDILLDNALKYGQEGSQVLVRLQGQGKYAVLCVDSCGAELSREDCSNIFRRFYTMDRARTGGSCGLGLSIAAGIVKEHGGRIWAESGSGHNRFYVKLPTEPKKI